MVNSNMFETIPNSYRKYEFRKFGGKYNLTINHYENVSDTYLKYIFQRFNSIEEADDALIQIKLAT